MSDTPSSYLAAEFNEADYCERLQIYLEAPPANDTGDNTIQIDIPASADKAVRTMNDVMDQIRAGMELGGVTDYHMKNEGHVISMWFVNATDLLLAKASLYPDNPCNVLFQDMSAPGTTRKKIKRMALDLQELFEEVGAPQITFIPDFENKTIRLQAGRAVDFIECIGQMRAMTQEYNAEMQ